MKIALGSWNWVRKWGLKIGLVALAALWLSLIAASWADAAEELPANKGSGEFRGNRSPAGEGGRAIASSNSSGTSDDDEYNFNWLDPEKKIYVLQNRKYLKANRVMFSGMVGLGFSNPYRTTYNFDPRVAFYLSEAWGVEAFYTFTTNSANSTFNALAGTNTTILPVIREVRSQEGLALHWVPWYAKINVFNKILYFDWYFSAGLGAVQAAVYNSSTGTGPINPGEVDQTSFALFLGTGHIYHITDNLLVRLDFTSASFNSQVYGTGGGGNWYSNLNFGAGVGWRL